MKVVIVIPTYNEVENIGKMLDVLVQKELPKIKKHKVEILVVDSKSPDGTARVVKEKQKKYKKVHLLETDKEGLGADYIKGMKYAMNKLKGDAVVEFDADFQHDPKDIKKLVDAFDKGADYVIGSRYIKGGEIPKEWGIHRKLMSYLGSTFARAVFFMPNLHDLTSGMKLTRTTYLKKVDLDHLLSKYYAYKIHILHDVVRMGANTVEVPIKFKERVEGSSKISRKDLIDSFLVVLKLRMQDSERFIKFAVVGFLGFVVNFIFLRIFRSLGTSEVMAWLLSTELAIVNNYFLNNIWTFKSDKIGGLTKTLYKFAQFNLTSAGALVIQTITGPIGVSLVGAKYDWLVLMFVVAFMVLPYNYFMYNVVIWKTKKTK